MAGRFLNLRRSDGENYRLSLPEKIVFGLEAYGDMLLACLVCPLEISGFARVLKRENAFFIPDIIIPGQICSSSGTEYFATNAREELLKTEAEGKDRKDYYCWWHSHVSGRARFSRRDLRTIDDFLKYSLESEKLSNEKLAEVLGPWVSIVLNQRAEFSARYDFARPLHSELDVPVELETGIGEAEVRQYLVSNQDRIYRVVLEKVRVEIIGPFVLTLADFLKRLR